MFNRKSISVKFKLALMPTFVALLCSCATTQVSDNFPQNAKIDSQKPVALISSENYGYYLFGYLPLITGDPVQANKNTLTFFEDTVTIENNHEMINKEAQKVGATRLSSLGDNVDWTGGFSLWIIWKQVMKSTAIATNPIVTKLPDSEKTK